MTSRDWQKGRQLADHEHNGDNNGRNETVADEQAERTTIFERTADTEEDACADTRSNGDEDEMAWFERLLQSMFFVIFYWL